jgi:hypothetical protein
MDSTKEQLQGRDVWPYLKASLRSRTSVWIGVAAIVGWLLSRVPANKRLTYGVARRMSWRDADRSSLRLGQVRSWPLPGKRRRGLGIWSGQLANHPTLVDLLCRTDSSFWRRVHPGLREYVRHAR